MSGWVTVSDTATDAWDRKGTIQGVYVKRKSDIGPNNSNMYILKTDKGEIGVWGSTIIDSRFAQIAIGSEVRIEALKEEKSEKTGRTYQNYKVEYRPAPFREAGETSSDPTVPPVDVYDEVPF